MMNSWNAIGRIVQSTYKKTATSSFVKFTLAVQRTKQKGEKEARTDFIPCTLFGHPAEYFNNYLEKGDTISVSGALQLNSYEKNGQQITAIEVFATQVHLLNKPLKQATQQETAQMQTPTPPQIYQPPQVYQAPPQQMQQPQLPAPLPDSYPGNLPFELF